MDVNPSPEVNEAERNAEVRQFRLHKDSNLGIPLQRMTKSQFLREAVSVAYEDPSVLAKALASRLERQPSDVMNRVAITKNPRFDKQIEHLGCVLRVSGEEVVRLAVEYQIFCVGNNRNRSQK